MENKTPDKNYIKSYWKEVRRQAWDSAWKESGMKTLSSYLVVIVLGGIALSGILFLSGLLTYPFFRDNLLANALTALGQIIVSVVILIWLWLQLLQQIPPKLHKDKEDQIKELEPIEAKIEITIPSSPNPFDGKDIPLVYGSGSVAHLIIWNKNKTADLEKCFARFEYIGDVGFNGDQPLIYKFQEEDIQENILWDRKNLNDGTLTIAADGKEVLDILKVNDDGFDFLFQGNNNWKETIVNKNKKYNYLVSLKIFGHLNGHPIADVKELYVIHLEYFWVTNVPEGRKISDQELLNQKIEPRLQINKVAIKESAEN